jgi:hypothetical protein
MEILSIDFERVQWHLQVCSWSCLIDLNTFAVKKRIVILSSFMLILLRIPAACSVWRDRIQLPLQAAPCDISVTSGLFFTVPLPLRHARVMI